MAFDNLNFYLREQFGTCSMYCFFDPHSLTSKKKNKEKKNLRSFSYIILYQYIFIIG